MRARIVADLSDETHIRHRIPIGTELYVEPFVYGYMSPTYNVYLKPEEVEVIE